MAGDQHASCREAGKAGKAGKAQRHRVTNAAIFHFLFSGRAVPDSGAQEMVLVVRVSEKTLASWGISCVCVCWRAQSFHTQKRKENHI